MEKMTFEGELTEDGLLIIQLPTDLKPGRFEVEIRQPKIKGVTLGKVLDSGWVGVWADREDIADSEDYARELRKRASRRGES
jgi:hypothetical protein